MAGPDRGAGERALGAHAAARSLEHDGQYNAAKLFRAAGTAESIRAGNQGDRIVSNTPADVARATDANRDAVRTAARPRGRGSRGRPAVVAFLSPSDPG
jgi:hypothetical protein